MPVVYLLDDDAFFNKTLSAFLVKHNYIVESFFDAESLFRRLNSVPKHPDLIITDFRLPESDGIEVIKRTKKLNKSLPVVLITNYSNIKIAVKSIKIGAFEFVSKPIIPDEFLTIIDKAISTNQTNAKEILEPISMIKGNTMNDVWRNIEAVAPSNLSVLISGESGTGKELAARYIHEKSNRFKKKFVAIDCGALPEETVLSELFGHEIGAFTGATKPKIGQFEYANGGTVFLDEIGNLSYSSQVILLRALQEKSIKRLGGNSNIAVDIRLIAATNENLNTVISNNRFRLDLFYRINEFPIHLKPLRDRIEDLHLFIDLLGKNASKELAKPFLGIEKDLFEDFKSHSWPGNVRELKNLIRRGVLLSSDGFIKRNDLPNLGFDTIPTAKNVGTSLKHQNQNLEQQVIKAALIRNNYNKSKTAKELKITRTTLYKKIDEFKL